MCELNQGVREIYSEAPALVNYFLYKGGLTPEPNPHGCFDETGRAIRFTSATLFLAGASQSHS
jgi:hypothetical protein